MNQRGGLQRVVRPFAPHVRLGQGMKLLIDN
jgi:hypothetical protein